MNVSIDPKTLSLEAALFSPAVGLVDGLLVPNLRTQGSTDTVRSNSGLKALASLQRAVAEGSVFAAVTGPRYSGKSAIVTELLASSKRNSRVCVDIRAPDQVSAKTAEALAGKIETVVRQHASGRVHVLIVVDNAHTASSELLTLLNRFADARSSMGSPQIILVGEPDLWHHLGSHYYEKLLRRLAMRACVYT